LIVLAEDNQTDVFLVKESIAAHGLDVKLHVIDNGELAIGFIAQIDSDPDTTCPSLFLLDLNLPRIGGLDVLATIRQSKRCAKSPVLIMTSSDAEKDRAESTARGATGYFRKPSGYEAFLGLGNVIRHLIS
jgi:CheY-like chemotaxis protein